MKQLALLLLLSTFSYTSLPAQYWSKSNLRLDLDHDSDYLPNEFIAYDLDFDQFKEQLNSQKSEAIVITLPNASGALERFNIVEASIFHPNLQSRFPDIRSFKGYSIDNPGSYLRIGYGNGELHSLLLRNDGPTEYIDHIDSQRGTYAVYYKYNYGVKERHKFECLVGEDSVRPEELNSGDRHGDCSLRKYRLALACTGEYSDFHGGTVPLVLAAYNVAMTRVNGIYEKDAAITMELVPNTDELIFLDGATDPYTNESGSVMLNENQETCDEIIGFNNYDIGHVFSTGGGGIAQLRSPCTGSKARGVTGRPQPIDDPFTVDYVAHEMGHQFGGNHTQNNSCQRNGNTAVEPGSASTIMGYAGICSPNVQNNSDDHFHGITLQEIANFVTGNGNSCAEIVATTNSAPEVSVANASVTIPANNTFVLEAEATDADGDLLTYCWEQMDNEVGTMPPQGINEGGPLFRSNSPVSDPRRFFPKLTGSSTWEVLPTVSREMTFMCTVRDNNTSVGCTGQASIQIEVSDAVGPLTVSYPNTNIEWFAADLVTITWDVNGTDGAPTNTSEVDVYLSTDSGETWDIQLANDTPNDGELEITVPDVPTSTARVIVIANDNVYFDMSDEDFSISAEFTVSFSPFSQVVCGDDELVYTADIQSGEGFNGTVDLSVSELPVGATATLSATSVTPPAMVDVTISGLTNATAGSYLAQLTASSATTTLEEFFSINVQNSELGKTQLMLPNDGDIDLLTTVEFTWEAQEGVSIYQFQLSTNPAFPAGETTQATSTSSTVIQDDLLPGEVYYWRVRARSICSTGEYSETSAFRVEEIICVDNTSEDTPVIIPEEANVLIQSFITVTEPFDFLNSQLIILAEHSFVGDLSIEVVAPNGDVFSILDRPGVPGSTYGCERNNLILRIYNDAILTATDLENTCIQGGEAAINGDYQPIDPFTAFDPAETVGVWTINITDVFQQDGGLLVSWGFENCNKAIYNNIQTTGTESINVEKGESEFFNAVIFDIDSDPAYDLTLLNTPNEGDLMKDGEVLSIGDIITSEELMMDAITYMHSDNEAMTDGFDFDVVLPGVGGWLHKQRIDINILENGFQVVANVVNDLTCFESEDGSLTATVIDGEEPFMYSIDNINFQSENTFNNLSAGEYIIYVVDANDISRESDPVSISQPSVVNASVTLDGYDIVASAEGGTGDYMYSIDGVNFTSNNVFADRDNGEYEVSVMDENGCVSTSMIVVNIIELSADITVNDLACSDEPEGTIIVNGMGGIAPYTYSIGIEPFSEVNNFGNLSEGPYMISVKDDGGKVVSYEEVIVQSPDPITYTYSVSGDILTILAEGGAGDYMYSLDGSDFQVENVFTIGTELEYMLTIVDANNCEYEFDLIISAITSVDFSFTEFVCFDSNEGSVFVTGVEGGTAPYTYSLNGMMQEASGFTELSPGDYVLSVIDASGFAFDNSFTIMENTEISIIIESSRDTLYVDVSGGTPGYTYSIEGGESTVDPYFTDLPDGNYTVVVSDMLGCTAEVDVTFVDVINITNSVAIIMYPNPVLQNLNIEIGEKQHVINNISIIGMDGRKVLANNIYTQANTATLDLSNLIQGAYIVKIETEEGVAYSRFTKM